MEISLLAAAVCFGIISVLCFCRTGSSKGLLGIWTTGSTAVVLASGWMLRLLYTGQFQYSYVYNHTALALKPLYRISALWAGQEGSFLIWVLILSFIGFPIFFLKPHLTRRLLGIYGIICFSITLMCFVSQPFKRLTEIPGDGAGLSQALQDPWMAVHPPLVFVGYSLMAVIFSFTGVKDIGVADIRSIVKRYLLFALGFLGLGIFTGCVWAYRALGWGGYWAWDPIENAALVPWLIMCGYLHDRSGITRVRCLIPFTLALAGTFLTRSGILTERSAHAYTGESAMTTVMVSALLAACCGLLFYKLRGARIAPHLPKTISFPAVTYLYAGLVLLFTWEPLVFAYDIPLSFYNGVTAVYALATCIFLLKRNLGDVKKYIVTCMIIDTLLTMGVIYLFRIDSYIWLFLFWACMLPLPMLLLSVKRSNAGYTAYHIGLVLLIGGAIASSGFDRELTVVSSIAKDRFSISNRYVPLSALQEKTSFSVVTPFCDYIIDCRRVQFYGKNLLLPSTSKPLIGIFWLGGFLVCGSALIRGILKEP